MAQPPEASSHFARLDDIRVHYTNHGTGDFALVLVHGWNCDENVWKNQAPTLAKTTRVITVDLPGHGLSDKPKIDYTMDLHARALDAVLQDAEVETAVLVGHSNGTPVVRQYYRRYPEKVRGLVIVDGALRPFGDAAMMEKFIAPLRGPDYSAIVTRFVEGMTASMPAEEREQLKTMMLATPKHVAVSEMLALLDPALWEENKIEVPVLMVMAKQPRWTVEYEAFVRRLAPKLDYQMWEGVSHFVMLDKPDEFKAAVLAFLAQNDLAPHERAK
ncbi:MAG: alpha/beta hydrolase [Chthoniobacterales bacterium]|nr:alpha/beta hydrolase [Chthoniobacterales bacterium]